MKSCGSEYLIDLQSQLGLQNSKKFKNKQVIWA